MLSLHEKTADRWLRQIRGHLDLALIDHAHCEKKAAGTAMNLLFAYVDVEPLARAMAEIVEEELSHFRMVLDLLRARNIPFRKLPPSVYGAKLGLLIRKEEPSRAVDRLLVAGLIEARSCERFALLRDALQVDDPELSRFYGGLFESEARHHSTYVRLAREFADEATVSARLAELAEREAEIVAEGDERPRMHS